MKKELSLLASEAEILVNPPTNIRMLRRISIHAQNPSRLSSLMGDISLNGLLKILLSSGSMVFMNFISYGTAVALLSPMGN